MKKVIAMIISTTFIIEGILCGNIVTAYADDATVSKPEQNECMTEKKINDNVVPAKITNDNGFTAAQKKEIAENMNCLSKLGIPKDKVENVIVKKSKERKAEDILYKVNITGDTIDYITVKEESGDITMNVEEGEIHNELVVKKDGDIYVDGDKVLFENEDSLDSTIDGEAVPFVSGVTYTKKKPKEIKAWRGYSLNWICSSVKLQKRMGDLAVATVITVLMSSLAGSVAGVFAGDAITHLKSSDPYTKGISYKMWVANSKNPSTSRYTKLKQTLYSRKKFKGKKSSVVFYGRKG